MIAIEHKQMGYLTCKLTKAKAAADGSKSKDTPERSGSRRQRNVTLANRAGRLRVRKGEASLAPDLQALNRQRARLSRLRKSLGKHHRNSTAARMKPEILDQAFETVHNVSQKGVTNT